MDDFFDKFAQAVDTGVSAVRKLYDARTQVETVKANASLANSIIDLQRQALNRQATLTQLVPQPIQVPFGSTGTGFAGTAGSAAPVATAMPNQQMLMLIALALGAILLVRA